MTGTPNGDAPSILNASYTFKADIDVPQGGGRRHVRHAGRTLRRLRLLSLKSKPVFLWNLVGLKHVRWEGPRLSPGRHVLEFDFKYDGLGMGTLEFGSVSGIGRGGTGVLKVDGKEVARRDDGAHDSASFCSGTKVSTSAPTR